MSMFTLILCAIVILDIAWWWRADYVTRRLPRFSWLRPLVALFMAFQLGMILWIFSSRMFSTTRAAPPIALMSAIYLWHLIILPATMIFLIPTSIVRGFILLFDRFRPKPTNLTHGETDAQPAATSHSTSLTNLPASRREFLTALGVAAPPLLTGGLVAYSIPTLQHFRVRNLTIPFANLPPELDGLTIAHVSDVHVGTYTNDRLLKKIVDTVGTLDTDLVLLPGDLINNRLADLPAALDAVANMQSRHGTYMCIGNHDLIENGEEFIRRSNERVNLLLDESKTLTIKGQQVQLLGLPWRRKEFDIDASVHSLALRSQQPGAFQILLAHHPHAFDAAAEAGIPLTLAGHTHGGQLMLSENVGFGPAMYRYWSGLYRKPNLNNAAIVVSNGVGHWFPIRTAAPAEIVHITLRSQA